MIVLITIGRKSKKKAINNWMNCSQGKYKTLNIGHRI